MSDRDLTDKFCINCKYFSPRRTGWRTWFDDVSNRDDCYHPDNLRVSIDPVTGIKQTYVGNRPAILRTNSIKTQGYSGYCGAEGSWYEPKVL